VKSCQQLPVVGRVDGIILSWVERTGRDTLDTATTSQTADGGLGDALDVVAQNLAVALGAALAEALASLAA
jgi:hypothetical protein